MLVLTFQTGVYANVFDFCLAIIIRPSTSSTVRENEPHRHNSRIKWSTTTTTRTEQLLRGTNCRSLCEQDITGSESHFLTTISAIYIHLYLCLCQALWSTLYFPNTVAAGALPPTLNYRQEMIISSKFKTHLPHLAHSRRERGDLTVLPSGLPFPRFAPQVGPSPRRKLKDLWKGVFAC